MALIYVASAYTASTEAEIFLNVDHAINTGIMLHQKGHVPFIPHLTKMVSDYHRRMNMEDLQWEDYMHWCLESLKRCDALYYLSSSRGADIELEYAKITAMPIYYNIEDVPNHK